MEYQASTHQSASPVDRTLAICLAAFSMFVVGYTATRTFLGQPSGQKAAVDPNVVPHQAALWSELGH